jgi:delta-aminolevulinic acid dehydratase/porphobilinogen synthase
MPIQKVNLDISEGADFIIMEPAMMNLTLILRVKQNHPLIPYCNQISGEYTIVELASTSMSI